MRRSYVPLILLPTEFSVAWYEIIMQQSLSIESPNCQLYFLGINTNFQEVRAVKIIPKVKFN